MAELVEEQQEDVLEPDEEKAGDPVEEPPRPVSPYDLPGDWYVIHSYSGYENKVKANLETRTRSMHMEDRIFEVAIPMEDVVEFKGGKKVTTPKKVFPGYILVRMYLDDDSWYAVRNTPGVTGFVGSGIKPTPLARREVERFLGVQEEEEKKKAPRFKPAWEIGENVRVVTGPFADFNGVIEAMNIDQQKVTVLVNIFGRDTPVELGFDDIQKQ
jgi:transcriptional antiterminator NusG